MKTISTLILTFSATMALSATNLKQQLTEIAENANIGNGSSDVKQYNKATFNFDLALAIDLQDIKKEFRGCGPYSTKTDIFNAVKQIKEFGYDEPTATALLELQKQKKISKVYMIKTNNEIDCSRMWVQVYTTEGLVLELYYGMND